MKNTKSVLAALIIFLFCAFIKAPYRTATGSIKGTVSPSDAGIRAWAISNRDTLKSIVADGVFVITDVKPGLYNLLIEARSPYKNGVVPEVTVVEGEVADVGEIRLSK